MATTRILQESQGHIVEDYYLYFADDLVDLEKYLPDYLSHPQSLQIKKCIEKFSDSFAYDPRGHAFRTDKLNNETELGYAFFLIAAEYVKSLKLKKWDWEQLKEKITEAFNPYVARKNDKRVVVCTKSFAPLDFNTLLKYVIPHVVVSQGKRYLDAYSISQKEETTLECQLLQFATDIKDTIASLDVTPRSECTFGKEEFYAYEYQQELLHDLTQAIWNQTYLQKKQFQFSNQQAFIKFIISFFEKGGDLYDKYTKPLTRRYMQLSYKQAVNEFFPALLFKTAQDNDLRFIPIERGLCVTTEYPEAPIVNFPDLSTDVKPPRFAQEVRNKVGLDAFIQEDYMQAPEIDAVEAAARLGRANKKVVTHSVSNSEYIAQNAQKLASSLLSFFAEKKPVSKPSPKLETTIVQKKNHKLIS